MYNDKGPNGDLATTPGHLVTDQSARAILTSCISTIKQAMIKKRRSFIIPKQKLSMQPNDTQILSGIA